MSDLNEDGFPDTPHRDVEDNVPHESAVKDVVDEQLQDTSAHAAIADAGAISGTFQQAEVAALRTKLNEVLAVLRDAGLIPT